MRLLQRSLPLWLLLVSVLATPSLALAQDGDGGEAAAPTVTDPAKMTAKQVEEADKARAKALEAALEPLLKGKADRWSVKVDKPAKPGEGFQGKVNDIMGSVNGVVSAVFFYDIGGSSMLGDDELIDATAAIDDHAKLAAAVAKLIAKADEEGYSMASGSVTLTIPTVTASGNDVQATLQVSRTGIPLAVLWLVLGAIFFTVRMGFVQLRCLGHAVKVTKGDYDNPDDEGEVSHFQALTAALSATVGLGNIAGVAIAISIGGPGATVWMIAAGFLGMASKFTECSLGQMYRQQRPDGSVMGGAMYYLSNGLKDMGMTGLGRVLAVLFAILCVGGSLAGGNSFQVNQSLGALAETVPFFKNPESGLVENGWVYGLIMTAMVAAVIMGGLKRIAQTAEKIVPTMCGIYVAACLAVIVMHAGDIPDAFGKIFGGAMTPDAGFGGMIGVLIVGFQRAAFSNEAGVGSAAIAHSAAKTEFPVREGIVALLEPMIDTIIVCTMTALVIVVTGAYDPANPEFSGFIASKNGAGLTSQAFKTTISWFPYVLSIAVVLFAFSTMISWSYYGERCWVWMFGDKSSMTYKVLFLVFVFLGSIITATNVLDFGDLMILGMALPNVLGVVLLSGKVREALDEYTGKLKSGELKSFK